MTDIITKTRKWGNSIGVVLPKNLGFKENQTVKIHISPAEKLTKVSSLFGMLKLKKDTTTIMKEIDTELDSEV